MSRFFRRSCACEAQLLQAVRVHSQRAATTEVRRISVCFTGHRHLSTAECAMLTPRLQSLLCALYKRGYRRFLCGGALGFDTLAAECVIRLQAQHEDVCLVMALPCSTQAQRWRPEDVRRYERILYAADETHVLAPNYYNGCMMVRNRFMVDRASFCVCYLNQMKGGTMSTVAYALKQHVPVLNAAMEDACAAYVRESAVVTASYPADPDDFPHS